MSDEVWRIIEHLGDGERATGVIFLALAIIGLVILHHLTHNRRR